jgi:hypothetical protein
MSNETLKRGAKIALIGGGSVALCAILFFTVLTMAPGGDSQPSTQPNTRSPVLPPSVIISDKANDFVKGEVEKAAGELERAIARYGVESNLIGAGVINNTEPTENNVVYVDRSTDELFIILQAFLSAETDIAVKILLDYEEQPFEVDGEIYRTYMLRYANNFVKDIPFRLTDDSFDANTSHILTIVIIPEAEKHAGTETILNVSSYAVDLELSSKSDKLKITPTEVAEKPEKYINLPYSGLMLNTDFNAIDSNEVKFPPKTIEVNAGETVKLAYRAGNYEIPGDLAVCVFVGMNQAKINGKPVLHITNRAGMIGFGTIEFAAPSESGQYDISAFVSPAAYHPRNADNAHISDWARRFTLIVK